MQYAQRTGLEIAVIGLAGRFPGAGDVAAFWDNLSQGRESITFFSAEELLAAGVNERLVRAPGYVPARGVLGDVDRFDAAFFGYSPKEAAMMDPQHRLFLETAWQGLEDAGYNARLYDGRIGVFASVGFNSYLVLNLQVAPDFIHAEHGPQAMLGNDKDFLATRVSYKFSLTGPSVVVQSACSSSLVALHQACQSLLAGEADMQLAGGVTVRVPEQTGHMYQDGMINSPDGHCRAFDKDAAGTVAGNGVGVVVLKRLEDALRDGDHIYAVIKATAVNNDGDDKAGYAAPSPSGQAHVIQTAQALAGIEPGTIGYVEAHGSGTRMGDPIEIEALRSAFGKQPYAPRSCAVGSVKSNIGHLDAAAGVAGFIKTVLALHHKQIPPSVNFSEPNPLCAFDDGPFWVNRDCLDWPGERHSRRAGVSSFGMGGTNAHVIVEEAPVPSASGPSRPWQLLCLSARTPSALDRIKDQMRAALPAHANTPLADVAYTLHLGRHHFSQNTALIARDTEDATRLLSSGHNERSFNGVADGVERLLTFMFSGQGSQFVHMGRALYDGEPSFRADVDRCADVLRPHLGRDLRELLYPAPEQEGQAAELLDQTAFTQSALFVSEYALARLLMRWGLQPEAMIGHSVGEYVAACLAGVFSLEDALYLVAQRGRLLQELPPGRMLFVPLPETEALPFVNERVALAAVNSSEAVVLSGEREAIEQVQAELELRGVRSKPLRTSHAFHSHMQEPILQAFAALFSRIALNPPKLKVVSNLTGNWLTAEQATDPAYWVQHLRRTVRFAAGIERLANGPKRCFVEVGPGKGLMQFAAQTLGRKSGHLFEACMPRPADGEDAAFHALRALGNLWLNGVTVDWRGFYSGQKRNRVSLPAYPFRGERYWVSMPGKSAVAEHAQDPEALYWSYEWRRTAAGGQPLERKQLLLAHRVGRGAPVLDKHAATYERAVVLEEAGALARADDKHFRVQAGRFEDYEQVFTGAGLQRDVPLDVVYLYPDVSDAELEDTVAALAAWHAFLRALASFASETKAPVHLTLLTRTAFDVSGGELQRGDRQLAARFASMLAALQPSIRWQAIDVGAALDARARRPALSPAFARWRRGLAGLAGVRPRPLSHLRRDLAAQEEELLRSDLERFSPEAVLAYRGGQRWQRELRSRALHGAAAVPARSVYLVLGVADALAAALVRDWHGAHGGRYVFMLAQPPQPASQWEALAQAGEAPYQTLCGLRAAGVPVDAHGIEEREAWMAILRGLARDEQLVAWSIAEAQPHEEDEVLLYLERDSLAQIAGGSAQQIDGLASLPLERWIRFAPSRALLDHPPCAVAVCEDALLRAGSKRLAPCLVYLNPEDFTEASPAGDERARQLTRAIQACKPGEAVWLSDRSPQALAWRPASARAAAQTDAEAGEAYARPELSTPYAAPVNERQKAVCAIWQALFQVDRVGIHDDFFDLGGDSVMALKLLSALESHFKLELPLAAVINAPTPAEQAHLVLEYSEVPMDQRKVSPLVALRKEGTKAPFFCVHPAGGIVHCYIEMMKRLDRERPFYGLQHPGIDGRTGPYGSYKKMAELYVDSMLEVQPQGPYFLGGWSFGGTVAYEMALQLVARGKEVGMLALFDSPGPSALYRLQGRPEFEFAGMMTFLSQALGNMFGAQINVPVEELRKIPRERQLEYLLERMVKVSGEGDLSNAREALERVIDIFELTDRAEREYEPAPYAGPIHLYRVQELADYEFTGYRDHPQLRSASFGWDALGPDLQVRFVPGTHMSMIFPPNVPVLVEKFHADLERCSAGAAARNETAGEAACAL